MNYWEEKPDFWRNKTKGNQIYRDQKIEAAHDISLLIDALDIKTVVDVGGYKGEMHTLLPDKVEYINLDIAEGFDLAGDWTEQMIQKNIVLPDPEKVLMFTIVTLICLSPSVAKHVIHQMQKRSLTQYYHEENIFPANRPGDDWILINNSYGGKWSYDWAKFIPGGIDELKSEVNPSWIRLFSKVK